MLIVALSPLRARADGAFPPPELLEQLRERLTEPAQCQPDCLSVASLALRVEPTRLSVIAEVHAQARASYQTPGPLESWAPSEVRVDGAEVLAALRADDGFLHVRIEPGVHTVELSGPLPESQAFTLALGSPPHRVRAVHPGFVVEGLRDDGRAEGSLSIRREMRTASAEGATNQGLMQWFVVRRELTLGVRFRVRTTITRLGPKNDAALLRVPLLRGEEVEEAGLAENNGAVVIELPRGESEKTFSSSIAPTPKLTLKAAEPRQGKGPRGASFQRGLVVRPKRAVPRDLRGHRTGAARRR